MITIFGDFRQFPLNFFLEPNVVKQPSVIRAKNGFAKFFGEKIFF
jgi:hypothetical protein